MIIYGALLSPFVRKVALVAAEKGLEYQLKLSSPRGPDPDFRAASPFGKIPALKDGDFTLADSSAIAVYLDAQYPAHPLIPADPRQRGRAIWFDEYADTILGTSGLKILFNRLVAPKLLKLPYDEAVAAQGEQELPPLYAYLESVAPAEGWLLGAEYTLADISVASGIRSLEYVDAQPRPGEYPGICAWYDRVRARHAWHLVAEQEAAFSRR